MVKWIRVINRESELGTLFIRYDRIESMLIGVDDKTSETHYWVYGFRTDGIYDGNEESDGLQIEPELYEFPFDIVNVSDSERLKRGSHD